MIAQLNKKGVAGISSTTFGYLRKLVREHSAIVLDENKEYLAELYLQPVAELAGFDSIDSFLKQLQSQPFNKSHEQVIEALANYETSFFRDFSTFEALKKSVLPELVEKQNVKRTLNIWCAACSSGQEPYSIAMLIREHFPTLAGWDVRIIASDFSSKILARASLGRYTELEINRGLPKNLRDKHFERQGNEWQIKEEIRHAVEFRLINLIHPWSLLPKMDIIFLRNVLIYFDTETKKEILRKAKQLLNPDGYLFLGGGETTINIDNSFARIQCGKSIYHKPDN